MRACPGLPAFCLRSRGAGFVTDRRLGAFVVCGGLHGRTAGANASCWYQPTHGRNDDSQAHHRNRSSPPRPGGRVFGSRPFRETPGEARMPDPDSFNGPLLRRQPRKTGNRLSGRLSIATGLMPRSDTALTFRLRYGFRESPFRAVPLLRLDTRIVLFGVPLRSIVFRSVSARPGRWVVAGNGPVERLASGRCRARRVKARPTGLELTRLDRTLDLHRRPVPSRQGCAPRSRRTPSHLRRPRSCRRRRRHLGSQQRVSRSPRSDAARRVRVDRSGRRPSRAELTRQARPGDQMAAKRLVTSRCTTQPRPTSRPTRAPHACASRHHACAASRTSLARPSMLHYCHPDRGPYSSPGSLRRARGPGRRSERHALTPTRPAMKLRAAGARQGRKSGHRPGRSRYGRPAPIVAPSLPP